MNDKEFFEFCMDRYKQEESQLEAIYQRAGFLLTALPILGAVAYHLGQAEFLRKAFLRVDIFLYVSGATAAFVCLAMSVFYLMRCVLPRGYSSLTILRKWDEWRAECTPPAGNNCDTPRDDTVTRGLITKIKEAQEDYAEKNESRRRNFRRSIIWAFVALISVGVEAFFSMVLSLQGVTANGQ